MGDRLRVAAATVNVVPFNCIICFEEFNLKDRLPQVLPCGHTFVCEPCSKRLKRCMECREPLYYTKSTVSPNKHMYRSPVGGRYSPTPMTPPQNSNSPLPGTVQQVRYPIAKNVVLMSMMEAAARMEKERQEGARDDSLRTDEEEELDINNIICGVANLTGPSGTYAVRDPKGIEIVKEIASALPPSERELNIAASEDSVEIREPGNTIARGQTVQVVSFSNGVAKLARGQGFVQADSSQLVRGKTQLLFCVWGEYVRLVPVLLLLALKTPLVQLLTPHRFSRFEQLGNQRKRHVVSKAFWIQSQGEELIWKRNLKITGKWRQNYVDKLTKKWPRNPIIPSFRTHPRLTLNPTPRLRALRARLPQRM